MNSIKARDPRKSLLKRYQDYWSHPLGPMSWKARFARIIALGLAFVGALAAFFSSSKQIDCHQILSDILYIRAEVAHSGLTSVSSDSTAPRDEGKGPTSRVCSKFDYQRAIRDLLTSAVTLATNPTSSSSFEEAAGSVISELRQHNHAAGRAIERRSPEAVAWYSISNSDRAVAREPKRDYVKLIDDAESAFAKLRYPDEPVPSPGVMTNLIAATAFGVHLFYLLLIVSEKVFVRPRDALSRGDLLVPVLLTLVYLCGAFESLWVMVHQPRTAKDALSFTGGWLTIGCGYRFFTLAGFLTVYVMSALMHIGRRPFFQNTTLTAEAHRTTLVWIDLSIVAVLSLALVLLLFGNPVLVGSHLFHVLGLKDLVIWLALFGWLFAELGVAGSFLRLAYQTQYETYLKSTHLEGEISKVALPTCFVQDIQKRESLIVFDYGCADGRRTSQIISLLDSVKKLKLRIIGYDIDHRWKPQFESRMQDLSNSRHEIKSEFIANLEDHRVMPGLVIASHVFEIDEIARSFREDWEKILREKCDGHSAEGIKARRVWLLVRGVGPDSILSTLAHYSAVEGFIGTVEHLWNRETLRDFVREMNLIRHDKQKATVVANGDQNRQDDPEFVPEFTGMPFGRVSQYFENNEAVAHDVGQMIAFLHRSKVGDATLKMLRWQCEQFEKPEDRRINCDDVLYLYYIELACQCRGVDSQGGQ